jgi:hypothetical protein
MIKEPRLKAMNSQFICENVLLNHALLAGDLICRQAKNGSHIEKKFLLHKVYRLLFRLCLPAGIRAYGQLIIATPDRVNDKQGSLLARV